MSGEATRWRFDRALARIEPTVEAVVAAHAVTYWGRAVRRLPLGGDGRLVWVIDGEPVLELRVLERGPSTLVVYDFSLWSPLRKAVRTRHVHIRIATSRDDLA